MHDQNQLKQLQENLARDLVHFETQVNDEQLAKLTDVYSQVYDIVTKLALDKPTDNAV
jgi:hypothetical protein